MVREKLPSILEPHSSLTFSWSTFQKDCSKTNKNYIDWVLAICQRLISTTHALFYFILMTCRVSSSSILIFIMMTFRHKNVCDSWLMFAKLRRIRKQRIDSGDLLQEPSNLSTYWFRGNCKSHHILCYHYTSLFLNLEAIDRNLYSRENFFYTLSILIQERL